MNYRLPEISDEEVLQEYIQEHYNNNENNISTSLGLSSSEYKKWVETIQTNAVTGDILWGKSFLYLCFEGCSNY